MSESEVILARRFAALSGPFHPADALKASIPQVARTPEALVSVATRLAGLCDTRAGEEGSQWLMRATERRWEINALVTGGTLAEAVEWRRGQTPFDQLSQDLTAALHGDGIFEPAALQIRLARMTGTERAELEGLATALEWAGPAAPAYDQLDGIRALLNRLDDQERADTILIGGFHGREADRQALRHWLSKPAAGPPLKAMFIAGLPGIGKSALLEIAIRDAAADGRPLLVIRLDFERPGLDVLDQVGLTLEVARQIANHVPARSQDFRAARLDAASALKEELKGRSRDVLPTKLAQELGDLAKSGKHAVLMVLDTVEVLQARGETHPRRLFEWLDGLAALGLAPMAVIAAGRGDAFDRIPERIGHRRELQASDATLGHYGVPGGLHATVRDIAGDDPRLLRLASAAVVEGGGLKGKALSKSSGQTTQHLSAGTLYRTLLSRLPDRDLCRLTYPGLLVRRLNHEVVREVLAPALGLKDMTEARARDLVGQLSEQRWLMEQEPLAEGWLRQHPETRAVLLPVFFETKPALCAKIARAAADWFARRPEPWLQAETVYYRLQLSRRKAPLPVVAPAVAQQFDEAMLHELPDDARDAVMQARGQRSTFSRGAERPAQKPLVDDRAVRDMQLVLERGDWEEAADIYDHAFDKRNIKPASRAGDSARTFLWRTGRWYEARWLLQAMDDIRPGDIDLPDLRPNEALARLEMRAEFDFAALVRHLMESADWRANAEKFILGGGKVEMISGALGFAARLAGLDIQATWRDIDPVGAAHQLWDERQTAVLDSAMAQAQLRMSRWLPEGLDEADAASLDAVPFKRGFAARQLSVLSPYSAPIDLAVRFEAKGRLKQHAQSVLEQLATLNAWWHGGFGVAGFLRDRRADNPQHALADLGLLADWAGAAAFIQGGRDMWLLSQPAEAWRRTTAGSWAYPLPADGWLGADHAQGLDATTWMRLRELLTADDPVELSRRVLSAWSGASIAESGKACDRIFGSLEAAIDQAAGAAGQAQSPGDAAFVAARALMESEAPSIFVPALAVLIHLNHVPIGGRHAGGE